MVVRRLTELLVHMEIVETGTLCLISACLMLATFLHLRQNARTISPE